MANVIMSPHPKRIRTFIKNGQIYQGGAEEVLGNPMARNLGGIGGPDQLPEASPETKTE